MTSSSSTSSSSESQGKDETSWFNFDLKVGEIVDREVRAPVRRQIAEARENVAGWWSQSGFGSITKAAIDLPAKPQQILRESKDRMLEYSEEANRRFPYFATVCRSHETLMLGATALLVGVPAKRLPTKYFVVSLALSLAITKAGITIFNSKYELAGDDSHQ